MVSLLEEPKYKDDKFVIFSEWLEPIRELSKRLNKLNIDHGQIEGKVPSDARSKVIKAFTNAKWQYVLIIQVSYYSFSTKHLLLMLSAYTNVCRNCLLKQIDAGGEGINLQAARIVINLTPNWNPCTEWQALGRVWRRGQVRVLANT